MYTKREEDTLDLILLGKNNREIADELFISKHTVKTHLDHIYAKEKVHSRIELIIKVLKKRFN